tara:strand:+ start:249 stop:407 length:159 start_codon:yes stop_codon:yes gene_type:complete
VVILARKNVTLSLEEDTYEQYREYCEKKAIALSRSIELFMEQRLKEETKNGR